MQGGWESSSRWASVRCFRAPAPTAQGHFAAHVSALESPAQLISNSQNTQEAAIRLLALHKVLKTLLILEALDPVQARLAPYKGCRPVTMASSPLLHGVPVKSVFKDAGSS